MQVSLMHVHGYVMAVVLIPRKLQCDFVIIIIVWVCHGIKLQFIIALIYTDNALYFTNNAALLCGS